MTQRDCILKLKNIGKSFFDVLVLKNVDLDIYAGEVHCLVGENGAGKSTLCKIIAGIYPFEQGEMFYEGKSYFPKTVKEAQSLGIGFIHQELMLVPQLSVLENIFLGNEKTVFCGKMDWQTMRHKTQQIISELELDIDPDAKVADLSIAQQQMVEIAKAVFSEYKVIIFDEPTSSISRKNTQTLFKIIHQLKEKSVAMIYISHRLDEFQYIADQVTVLRDGIRTGTMAYRDTSPDEIVKLMVGREINFAEYHRHYLPTREVLRVESLTNKHIKSSSFSLYEGEILGFAGLVGAGRTELLRAIFGADEASGAIYLNAQRVEIRSPEDAVKQKIGFITEDRKQQGLILGLSIRENITLPILKRFWNGLFLNKKQERLVAEENRQKLRIVSHSQDQISQTLSGGNQQKVIIARWLESGVNILFFDEPTRGIDVGAKSEIYDLMRQFTDNGGAIVMVSSDLPELITMSDRVIVMRQGEIVREVKDKAEMTEENLMRLMIGVDE
ncbi:sugar ABC transporter ATP-binding protein [Pasteurella multocida]|uniref:sugar ABC transporter ATP-binding protein n=1 Tax=Pasteurella multocida TaxID=747 RepID=UPI002B4A0354|nr:sugar ABC transporter ATP-binding protein [Pasteurella multocida]MEB3475642.1 sugar ABC transporter ATP-binding protein [Pasteurella multocida]MEB3507409.1 sugar ABC transporter ATP-binding protein [Pasteurella multocida]WRJ98728.1 sugar ABC transporter ATP-binding protein [Pasteurella multocida]